LKLTTTRREWLAGASALAFATTLPDLASAWTHGSPAGFNNGKTQMQSFLPNGSGDWPFINLLKTAGGWTGGTTNTIIDPSMLDANGYPAQASFSSEVFLPVGVPFSTGKAATVGNPFVAVWVGNTRIRMSVTNGFTVVSGSQDAVLNGYGFSDGLYHGRYVFYPTQYDPVTNSVSIQFIINAMNSGGGSGMNNAALYFLSDETSYQAGKFFAPQFLSVLQSGNPGVFRFMDWIQTNNANTTTWASRKSLSAPTWTDPEWRANLYPGDIMTNSGNDYAITTGSFTLVDKLTMHVRFNADSTLLVNSTFGAGGSPQTLTMALSGPGGAIVFTWPSLPLVNGDPVGLLTQGNPPTGLTQQGINYYVVNKSGNTFQIALSPGGSAIIPAALNDASVAIYRSPTLNLNSTTAYPIKGSNGWVLQSNILSQFSVGKLIWTTVTFSAALGCWFLAGAQNATGLTNGVPIEVCVQLCKEIRCHPMFSIPYLCMDPMTDYVSNLATYVKNNGPSWMIPRFEPGNEVWNGGGTLGQYVGAISFLHWGANSGWVDWLGLVGSTVGQAVASVYGHGNLGVAYEVTVGPQTDGLTFPIAGGTATGTGSGTNLTLTGTTANVFNTYNVYGPGVPVGTTIVSGGTARDGVYVTSNPTTSSGAALVFGGALDPCLTSVAYLLNGPTQVGYTQSAAADWVSAVMPSTYISPQMRGTILEMQTIFDYYITSVGNPTQQAADLNAFVDTLHINGTASFSSGAADITWTASNLPINYGVIFNNVGTATNLAVGVTYYVVSATVNTFQVAASAGGAVITPNGNASNVAIAVSWGFTTDYEAARWHGATDWAKRFGVNKMFAYEGGYSPDLLKSGNVIGPFNSAMSTSPTSASFTGTQSGTNLTVASINNNSFISLGDTIVGTGVAGGTIIVSQTSGLPGRNGVYVTNNSGTASSAICTSITRSPTKATQCVVSIGNGSSEDAGGPTAGATLFGNPYIANSLVSFLGSGMPELVNQSSGITLSSAGANQTWTAHNLQLNEVVVFSGGNVPSNIAVGQSYYVVSVPDANTFQFSATRGGSPITPNASNGVNVLSAFTVVNVSGGLTTIDVNSTGFANPTAGMFAFPTNSITLINNFRTTTLLSATHMQAQITTAIAAFENLGGSFFSQYELAGTGAIWPPIQPDIWGTQSGEFAAYVAHNH
jgi:hypothetical protein